MAIKQHRRDPNYAQSNLTNLGVTQYHDNTMNKKPLELHIVDGTVPRRDRTLSLPDAFKTLRKRIPQAEWLANPDIWDKPKFIDETSEFLNEAYGIGNDQDKHILAMLANHMETFVLCCKSIESEGLLSEFNGGQTIAANPLIAIRAKTTTLIIQLMNELGLTPRGRFSQGKPDDNSDIAKFLRGPLG